MAGAFFSLTQKQTGKYILTFPVQVTIIFNMLVWLSW